MFDRSKVRDLAGLILVAAAFRLAFVSQEALTIDADRSRYYGMMDPLVYLQGLPTIEPHPPLYYWAIHYSTEIFGPTHFGVRLPSVLAGILLVPVVYLLATDLWDRRVALYAGSIAAVSPYLVQWSQTARMYSFLGFFGVLSWYFFVRIDQDGLDRYRGFGYTLAIAGAMYSHILGTVVLFSQLSFVAASFLLPYLRDREQALRQWLTIAGVGGVLATPVVVFVVLRMRAGLSHGGRTKPPVPKDLFVVFAKFLGFGNFPHRPVYFALLVPAVTVATILPLIRYDLPESLGQTSRRNLRTIRPTLDDDRNWLLLFWIGTPFAVLFPLSFVVNPIVGNRYYIVAGVGIYVLIASGIATIDRKPLRVLTLAVIVVGFAATSGVYLVEDQSPAWDDGVSYIEANNQPGDLVISGNPQPEDEVWYYASEYDFTHKSLSFHPNSSEVCSLVEGYDRIWIVGFSGREDTAADILDDSHVLNDSQNFNGLDVYLFASNGTNCNG